MRMIRNASGVSKTAKHLGPYILLASDKKIAGFHQHFTTEGALEPAVPARLKLAGFGAQGFQHFYVGNLHPGEPSAEF